MKEVVFGNWFCLSLNPYALLLFEDNVTKIDIRVLSLNPLTIPLYEANNGKIDWDILSIGSDDNILSYLEDRVKIDCYLLSRNPAIFE